MAPVIPPVRAALRAMARAMVPATQQYAEADWADFEQRIEGALAPRPPRVRAQFATFVRLANWLAVPLAGKPLVALAPAAAERVLHRLERAPVALIRRGTWGVRTMAFLGHYTRASAIAASGWRGDARGWDAPGRRDANGQRRLRA